MAAVRPAMGLFHLLRVFGSKEQRTKLYCAAVKRNIAAVRISFPSGGKACLPGPASKPGHPCTINTAKQACRPAAQARRAALCAAQKGPRRPDAAGDLKDGSHSRKGEPRRCVQALQPAGKPAHPALTLSQDACAQSIQRNKPAGRQQRTRKVELFVAQKSPRRPDAAGGLKDGSHSRKEKPCRCAHKLSIWRKGLSARSRF